MGSFSGAGVAPPGPSQPADQSPARPAPEARGPRGGTRFRRLRENRRPCAPEQRRLTCALSLLGIALLTAAAAVGAAVPSATLSAEVACGVTAYHAPVPMALDRIHGVPTTAANGSLNIDVGCGKLDIFAFGAGLSQAFGGAGRAAARGRVGPGVLRGYAGLVSDVSPSSYGGPGLVPGTNPYFALARATLTATFTDIVTPPVTGTLGAGDPTTLEATLHLDCGLDGTYQVLYYNCAQLAVYVRRASDDMQLGGFLLDTCNGGTFQKACPLGYTATVPVHVGEAVSVYTYLFLTVAHFQASDHSTYHQASSIDALNTGTLVLKSADGMPVTGDSGHVYAEPGPQDPIPLPTTTVPTTTSSTTSTTLPTCAGTCGDGIAEADCAEACDCLPTADPVRAAYGCAGGDVVPPQPGCVICRGCALDTTLCASDLVPTTSTTTTSITTIPTTESTSTSTTLPPGPAPSPCASLAGLVRVRCEIDDALAHPLCGDGAVPARLDGRLRAKLTAAATLLDKAIAAPGPKQEKLLGKVRGKLGIVKLQSAGAARAKSPKRRIATACAAAIGRLINAAVAQIAAP